MAKARSNSVKDRAEGQQAANRSMAGFDMYGISGLSRYGPISRIYEEFAKELQGPQGMKNYREMMDNCAIVGAILFAAQHLCRKVSWKMIPADSSQEARKVADFVGGCIFDDLSQTWQDTISEILSMLPFGWAAMEFSFKRRLGLSEPNLKPSPEPYTHISDDGVGSKRKRFVPSKFDDGMIGFREWSLRSQETLFMWEFDEDSNATHMQQMAPPDYRIRRIPMSKVLLFRTQVSKNNPEGRSILRNAWTSYYMKKNLQIFEGIGIERDMAGYPMIQIAKPEPNQNLFVPDIWNPKDQDMVMLLATLKKMVRSVRRDEQEGMVMPWWAEFKLVSTGSRRRPETNDIIARYDQRIAMSMMADFIMLGHEAVGSKALAATKISLFTSALSSFLDTASAIISRDAISVLLQFNSIDPKLAPTMQHGDVESINVQELGEFISAVTQTGFNPLKTREAQVAAMEAAKLPTSGVDGSLTIPLKNAVVPGEEDATAPPKGPKGAGKDSKSTSGSPDSGGKVGDSRANDETPSGSGPVMPQETVTGTPDILETS